jgi:hypothetical protein
MVRICGLKNGKEVIHKLFIEETDKPTYMFQSGGGSILTER